MEPNFLGCGGFELVGSGSRIIRPDPTFLHTKPVLRFRFSGFAFSIRRGSGSDISIWCGSRSCFSSNWYESATAGLQTLYVSVLNLCASTCETPRPTLNVYSFWNMFSMRIRNRLFTLIADLDFLWCGSGSGSLKWCGFGSATQKKKRNFIHDQSKSMQITSIGTTSEKSWCSPF